MFFIVEKGRWGTLSGLIPADSRGSLIKLDDSNNKFLLGLGAAVVTAVNRPSGGRPQRHASRLQEHCRAPYLALR